MRASAAARPTPVPAPVTIAIFGVVMDLCPLALGCISARSRGALAYDGGIGTARLGDAVRPDHQAEYATAALASSDAHREFYSRVERAAEERPGSSRRKKQTICKEHSSRF